MEILSYIGLLFNLNSLEIFARQNWFLIMGVLFWVFIAVVQDFRKREVANWWSFSLIAFILAYRAFVAVYFGNWMYLGWGLVGLVIGFILSNVFYYARMFAGGDSKLLMALGAFLPLSNTFGENISIFLLFTLLFIIAGSVYGLVYSLIIMLINFSKFINSFKNQFSKYKIQTLSFISFMALICIGFLFFKIEAGVILSLILMILPLLLLGAKAIEESCLTKKILVGDLTIGDWLVNSIKVGKKLIKPNWEGLSEEELEVINKKFGKKKKVEVKYGIPFTPAFLLAILLLIRIVYLI
jgi:Flp pilus assembly protein protease CpaA